MFEVLRTELVIKDEDGTMTLEITMPDDDWDVIDIQIGEYEFRADWSGNLAKFFKRALELWPVQGSGDCRTSRGDKT